MHVKLRENRLIEGELTWFVTGTRSRLMPEMLASYVAGEWYTAPDEGATVVDAATGDPVARVSTTRPRHPKARRACAARGWSRAPRSHVPGTRRGVEGPGHLPRRPQGRVSRALAGDRRDAA